jgi:hypothetical protein
MNTLDVLKLDLASKETDKRNYIEKTESAKIRIKSQEEEILNLQNAAEDMRKQERAETARIDGLRVEIRR